ncbi:type II toxin-antitoxin system Phd/YefM family antitoxin [Pseudomonas sp. NPDC087358]|uniref:type II toxin-antitoxin system Phd/YefM family antitoxin n=1 Tax=Pseudomonas sp. NPDC087358 TaxID=3364439 RepID=UPI00384F7EFC
MQTHDIDAAKMHLSRLVDAAARGETIIIAKAGVPIAKLTAVTTVKRRGMLTGVTFDAETSEDLDAGIAGLVEADE